MFEKGKSKYVTKGIMKNISIGLQMFMWDAVDNLKNELGKDVDYLQVFEIQKKDDSIIIEHRQEIPEYKKVYTMVIPDIDIDDKVKIFVIDDVKYSTMLLAEEY